jgi:CheY-like chemotaxis protein
MGQSIHRILIVDDNQEAADITAELLSMYGYQTKVAYDGAAGLEAAHQFAPQAVLLDLGMPGMDGFQVASSLRTLPVCHDAALVALTAWGDPATRARTSEAGFDHHLIKPASLDSILASLAYAADARAIRRAASHGAA